jgi:hypothetical protein
MNKLIDIIVKYLENDNYILIIIILFVVFFFKFETIFKSFDNIKKNKINFLFDLEKKPFMEESTKESIQEAINNDIFKVTTGIRTNKYMREKIIELYKEKKGEVTLYDIKNAIPFLKIDNDSLIIELKKQDKIWSIFNLLFGFLTLSLGLILIMLFPMTSSSISEKLTSFIIGIGLLFITFPVLEEVRAYNAAKKIKKILN